MCVLDIVRFVYSALIICIIAQTVDRHNYILYLHLYFDCIVTLCKAHCVALCMKCAI